MIETQIEREPLLTAKEVSKILNVPVMTLYQWKYKGINLPYTQLGGKLIRYKLKDVLEFRDRDYHQVNN